MRAHGESEGEWTGSGWLDRRDIIAWCSWIIARTGEEAPDHHPWYRHGCYRCTIRCTRKGFPRSGSSHCQRFGVHRYLERNRTAPPLETDSRNPNQCWTSAELYSGKAREAMILAKEISFPEYRAYPRHCLSCTAKKMLARHHIWAYTLPWLLAATLIPLLMPSPPSKSWQI